MAAASSTMQSQPAPYIGGIDATIYQRVLPQPSPLTFLSQAPQLRALQLANQRHRLEQQQLQIEYQQPPAASSTAFAESLFRPARPSAPPPPALSNAPTSLSSALRTVPRTPGIAHSALPRLDGLTMEQVRAYLGTPVSTTKPMSGTVIWSYLTPDGMQEVIFRAAKPTLQKRAPAAAPIQAQPPAVAVPNGCNHLMSLPIQRRVVVIADSTPAFVEPQFRQEAVATFAAGAVLSVDEATGPW